MFRIRNTACHYQKAKAIWTSQQQKWNKQVVIFVLNFYSFDGKYKIEQ